MRLSRLYLDALRAADAPRAYQVAAAALADRMPAATLYQAVIAPAMHEIGRLWERGALTVADEHLATAVTHRVLGALHPPTGGSEPGAGTQRPRAILAAVQGEQHALGLRMAADLLEEIGYDTLYLGADVPTTALLQAIETLSPDLLALTATMPKSGERLREVIATVRAEQPRLNLVFGGQGIASPQVGEATPVENLELLGSRLRA